MAIWQAPFAIIPPGSFPPNYRERLDAVAPQYESWSSDLLAWGDENGHRVEIFHEDGEPVEGTLRVDVRDPDPEFIRGVLAFLRDAGLGLEDEGGERLTSQADEFTRTLRRSRACRFVTDPELHLRRVQIGGLDDA